MSGAYRIEISSNNRAGCQNKECKDGGVKIHMGQIRYGTFATIGEFQSWKWKHWGCVTPKQISNLKTTIEDDLQSLDGYEELSEDAQKKVRKALEEGHVADDDWVGDIEMNRPGMNGFRVTASIRKKKEKEAERQAKAERIASPSVAASKKRRRIKDDPDAEQPAVKKTKAVPKKEKKVKQEELNDGSEDEAQPKKRARKPKVKAEDESGVPIKDENSDQVVAPLPPVKKARAPRKTTSSKKVKAKEVDSEASSDESGPAPTTKTEANSKRPAKEVKTENADPDEMNESVPIAPSKKAPVPRKTVAKKIKTEDADSDAVNETTKRAHAKKATTTHANVKETEANSEGDVGDTGAEFKDTVNEKTEEQKSEAEYSRGEKAKPKNNRKKAPEEVAASTAVKADKKKTGFQETAGPGDAEKPARSGGRVTRSHRG